MLTLAADAVRNQKRLGGAADDADVAESLPDFIE